MSFKSNTTARITSWSPSKLAGYYECPAKTKYKYIDKLPDPGGPALERGSDIHKAAEMYVTGRRKDLHADLKNPKVSKLLGTLRKDYTAKKVRVEMELAFNKAWKAVHWLATDVYVRFKIDVVHFTKGGGANVIDWKTGRFKDEGVGYDGQLAAYAVAVLSTGLVTSATAQLVFTDAGEIVQRPAGTLAAKDLKAAQEAWDKKAKPMLVDTKFAPRPGEYCRFCPFSTNKGGPCRF